MSSISFFSEDTDFSLTKPQKTRNWIKKIVKDKGFILIHLNIIFGSDKYLYGLNMQHLGHETHTDVITFDLSDDSKEIEGDIFISIDRVSENSDLYNSSFHRELHRVIIHGVLHLMEYSDKTSKDKRRMREKEDSCLSLYPK